MTGSGDSSNPWAPLGAEELRLLVRLLHLVPVPEALVPSVLAKVRAYRASMELFESSGIDPANVVTAQPYRAGEGRR